MFTNSYTRADLKYLKTLYSRYMHLIIILFYLQKDIAYVYLRKLKKIKVKEIGNITSLGLEPVGEVEKLFFFCAEIESLVRCLGTGAWVGGAGCGGGG